MTTRRARAGSKVILASEMHRVPGEIIKRVSLGQETLIVERDNYPVMVLLPYHIYEAWQQERLADEVMAAEPTKKTRKARVKKPANGTN